VKLSVPPGYLSGRWKSSKNSSGRNSNEQQPD
jgi:hypothetical protein